MKKLFTTVLLSSMALSALTIGCRPRASRTSAARRTAAQPATNAAAGTPTAKSVLTHADSALSRISQLNQEPVADVPPVAQQMAYPPQPMYPPMMPMRSPTGSFVPPPQPSISDYGLYEAALGEYNRHQYDEAINLFSQVVQSGRPPELIPNAYYWTGEAYYALGRYAESMPYFEYVTNVGPQYKREMSLYKLSRASLHLGDRQAANMWYERLRNDYPKSSYAKTLAKLGTR